MTGDAFADLTSDILCTGLRDDEFSNIIAAKPSPFAMSRLPSAKEEAWRLAREQAEKQTCKVQDAAAAVLDAKWTFFKTSLQKAQATLTSAHAAHGAVRDLAHVKEVEA